MLRFLTHAPTTVQHYLGTDLERPDLELVWIKIFYEQTSFLAGCCYRKPASTSAFYNLLQTSLESASLSEIVLLDFNAKRSHRQQCNDTHTTDGAF